MIMSIFLNSLFFQDVPSSSGEQQSSMIEVYAQMFTNLRLCQIKHDVLNIINKTSGHR
jgi:hypothetical protein